MKEYSLNQIIYIDSESLKAILENHTSYSKNTVVIAEAELDRRNLLTPELNSKVNEFCLSNNITDLKSVFLNILEKQGLVMNEWLQMGRETTPIAEQRKKLIIEDVQTDPILNWKEARNGILIFCVIHFIFEIASGNTTAVGAPVFFNYFISRWYINRQIEKGIKQDSFLLYGITIAGIVFIIRLILGFIVFSLIIGRLKG